MKRRIDTIYNSREMVLDENLTFLSYNQCINDEFTIEEILKSPLWITDYNPLFVDKGVTGNKNNKWVNQSNAFNIVTDGTGTILTEQSAGNYTPSSVEGSTNWNNHLTFDMGVYVEFDVVNVNKAMFRVYYDSFSPQITFNLETGHYKFFIDTGIIKYWIDSVEQSPIINSDIKNHLIFSFVASNDRVTSVLKYKNFRVSRSGGIKAIPLFNCDSIQSNNPNDIILDDNKCVILNNDDNTIITAKSDDTGSMHIYDVILHSYVAYSSLIKNLAIYCIVYDKFMNPLTNTVITVKKDGTVIDTVKTDYSGVCEYKVENAGSYNFIYDEKESETITITGE